MRGDVTAAPGVDVVPPDPADALGPFEDDEVAFALIEEPDRGADAGEAGSHDENARALGVRVPGIVVHGFVSPLRLAAGRDALWPKTGVAPAGGTKSG